MNELPTPETDLEEAHQTQRFGVYMVKSSFARKLERERDKYKEERDDLQVICDAQQQLVTEQAKKLVEMADKF